MLDYIDLTTADNLTLKTYRWQTAQSAKATIAIIHGVGEHAARYDHVAKAFSASGIQSFAFDLRGHGHSPGKRGHTPSMDTWLDDLERFITLIKESTQPKPFFLYGHSLGGLIVLTYLLTKKPDISGAIVTSPPLKLRVKGELWKRLARPIANIIWPSFIAPSGLKAAHLAHQPEIINEYKQDPLVHGQVSARAFTAVVKGGPWVIKHADQLSSPVLLLHGQSDYITDPTGSHDFAERAQNNCIFTLWKNGFHELHNDTDKERFITTLIEWILSYDS